MSDEFFIDDDVILSFDDNMIEEVIPNVSVIEERFKEDSILRLNQDQIKAEVTNLIIDRYNKSSVLKAKVANYTSLFFQFPHVSKINIKQVKPVIYSDKLTYFTNDDEHSQNKEYERSQFQKSEKLSNFISQFHSINRDMSKQSSLLSSNKLYALYTPFANRDDEDVATLMYQPQEDEDALRHCFLEDFECQSSINDTVRIIAKVQNSKNVVYDGDNVNVIGFYNLAPSSSTYANSSIKVFDIQKYLNALGKLEEGDKVLIVFNEPAFSKSGQALLKQINGTVQAKSDKKIVIHLSKEVLYRGSVIEHIDYDLLTLPSELFVYPSSTSTKDTIYTKQMLGTHNIIFKLPQTHKYTVEEVKSFIVPTTVAEILMLGEECFKDIHNLQDLNDWLLVPYMIDINTLTTDVHDLLKYIINHDKSYRQSSSRKPKQNSNILPYHNTTVLTDFAKNQAYMSLYASEYPSYDKFIDDVLNRFRHLRSQNDKGAFYFLTLLKHSIQKKYKKHIVKLSDFIKDLAKTEKTLEGIELPSSNDKNPCEATYAKEYKKLDKLLDDNNKDVHFDKKYDKTDYKLKDGFTGTSKKELKLYLLNEMTTLQKYKGYSKDDLEFEINAIVEGKRPLRYGDMCILHTSSGDVVYSRKLVQDKPMWVKKFRTPYTICTDSPLMKFDDLIKLDTCVKQTFDDICQTNRNAKVLHKYKLLMSIKTELSSVLSLLDNYDAILETLENDMEYYKRFSQIVPSEHKPDRKFEYTEHVDYDEYHGVEGEVGDVEYVVQYEDQSNFVVVPTSGNGNGNSETNKEVLENQDILNMLLSFLQLDIEEQEKAYILNGLNAKFPRKNNDITLQKYKEKFMNEVNKDAYKSSEKYMKMFDNIVKQKLDKIEAELIKKYFFNVFRYAISMIIILIFVRYPNYVMKRVHPSCVKFLNYMGHPVSDSKDPQKSLVAYMACILINVSVPEDIRFALFYEKDSGEIQKVLRETIDEILDTSYELRTQLELTRQVMKTESAALKIQVSHEYNNMTSFKPRFKFGNTDRMTKQNRNIIKFIKSIQHLVSSSKVMKQSGLNVPNLSNACCNERLVKDADFFNFFETNNEFKSAKSTLSNTLQKPSFVDENLHPPYKHEATTDLFAKYSIQHQVTQVTPMEFVEIKQEAVKGQDAIKLFLETNKTVDSITTNTVLVELAKNYTIDDWWNDIFYPTFLNDISEFETTFNKVSDKLNKDDFEYIKDIIINVNSSFDPSTVRHTLYMFLSSKLKLILGKICNKQKLTEKMLSEESIKSNPIYAIIASVTSNKNFDSLAPRLKSVLAITQHIEKLYIETTDADMIVKNISILAYMTFFIFKQLLLQPISKDGKASKHTLKEVVQAISPADKDNVKITCDIIGLLFSSLSSQLKNTIIDNDALKMSVEALREKRKQELINAYKVDEEERELQKQLKKLGLDSWADILTGEDDIVSEDVIASNNVKSVVKDEYEEEKDYVYSTYQGENADDDEVDEDYVSYESYDN